LFKGERNEHLDDIILHSFNRLDQRLHRVSRGGRDHPLATRIRGDLSNTAFCSGQADRLVNYQYGMLSPHGRVDGCLVGAMKVAFNGVPIRSRNERSGF
jgi:hypothetical protein